MHKHRIFAFLVLVVVLAGAIPFFALAAEAQVSLSVSCPDTVTVGSELRVKVVLEKPKAPLAGIEFSMSFDPLSVEPKIVSNTNREMDAFSKKVPSGWEQMNSFSESESKYYFRYLMPEGGSPVSAGEKLVLEIPFLVKKAGNFGFEITDGDIIGVLDDDALTCVSGVGSSCFCSAVGESDSVTVMLSGGETAPSKGRYDVVATVTNVGDASGVIAVEFELCYDKNIFSPVVTSNESSQMDSFLSEMPGDGWEQMCTLDAENGVYVIRLAAISVGEKEEELLKKGGSFSVTVPFFVGDAEGESGVFSVKNDLIAVNADSGILTGVGSSLSIPVSESIWGDIPEPLWKEDGFLRGVKAGTSVPELSTVLGGAQIFDKNGSPVTSGTAASGMTVTCFGETLTVCVTGDANGSGGIEATDYIMAKRMCLGTYDGSRCAVLSAAVSGGSGVSSSDYVKLKRHVLGTYDIFGE